MIVVGAVLEQHRSSQHQATRSKHSSFPASYSLWPVQTQLVRGMAEVGEAALAEEYRQQLGLPPDTLAPPDPGADTLKAACNTSLTAPMLWLWLILLFQAEHGLLQQHAWASSGPCGELMRPCQYNRPSFICTVALTVLCAACSGHWCPGGCQA